MITLWLAVGVLAKAGDGPPPPVVVIRRGDDANYGARERFWAAKAEEWLEARIEAVQRVATRPRKERKRFAANFEHKAAEFVEHVPEMAARIDAFAALVAELSKPSPDMSEVYVAILEQRAAAYQAQVKLRRRRDTEAILMLIG